MGSSSLKSANKLYDPIRKRWVEKTPEELIRQLLVRQMVEQLGYPKSLIAIEKELFQLPHVTLTADQVPKRRADIIVFIKQDNNLTPALLIECKAVDLVPKFAQQVIGYNAFVGAPYVAIANQTHVLTGCYDPAAGIFRFTNGLPRFEQLHP